MYGLILAGGSGSRLWPLSRELYPKQLLNIQNSQSLLQSTFLRLKEYINPQNIISMTGVKHLSSVRYQLSAIADNPVVLSEPISKNTAPAIILGCKYILETSKEDPVILAVPSDHSIKDTKSFVETVQEAEKIAEKGYIVTFGIKPSYAETGYGYINTSDVKIGQGYEVKRFVEKPDEAAAERYIKEDNYYWNGGIFMFKASVLLEQASKYAPDIYKNLKNFDFTKSSEIPYIEFDKMPSISIDYAVMEKSDKIALVELLSDWNDLGSWQSIYNVKEKDSNNNVLVGDVVVNNVKNSLIYSQKEIVAVSNLENIILVETEDAIMTCKMDESQNVKKLYEKLKEKESDTVKLHKTVFRPWGYYTCMNSGKGYLTKTICVMPKQKLSIQSHNHRSEHWVVLEGKALVILNGREYNIDAGESIDIPIQAKHSLQNPYDEELKIIEVQKGDYISEDDIIRYEDCYGRV